MSHADTITAIDPFPLVAVKRGTTRFGVETFATFDRSRQWLPDAHIGIGSVCQKAVNQDQAGK